MLRLQCVLLSALLASSILTTVHTKRFGGRGGSHSYPHSGGLSGGSHSSYPKSPGLSGGSHGYPSSGGLSGTGSHGYPSSGGLSGGSHGYPSSGGLSGSGSKPGYPNTNGHHTSNHAYPAGSGLAGNTHGGHTTVNNNYHYHYSPPQQIRYQPTHGAPVNYPVYHGTPPTYVYQYQNSGSKYSSLLAGLALFNLGALAGTAYGHHSHTNYKPQPGEVCRFGVKKDNGDYEETKIDCQLITSFIFQAEASQNHPNNTTLVTTTVTNTTTTIMNNTNEVPVPVVASPDFSMLPNGTLVLSNETAIAANVTTANETDAKPVEVNNPMTSSVVVTSTTTNTTVINAVDVKGPPVDVTPGMKCYIIRNSSSSNLKKSVPCGLLQTYAQQSLKKNSAIRNTSLYTLLSVVVITLSLY